MADAKDPAYLTDAEGAACGFSARIDGLCLDPADLNALISRSRLARMRNVRRYDPLGAPVFVTVVCRDHRPLLNTARHKDVVRACLMRLRSDHAAKILAWVILDDHVHLLLGAGQSDISTLVGKFKQCVLRALFQPSIWQPRYFDHIIRDDDDLRAHMDYIHFNPRKHGYVVDPSDYEWSSMRRLVLRGFYAAGWGVTEEPATIVDGTGSE